MMTSKRGVRAAAKNAAAKLRQNEVSDEDGSQPRGSAVSNVESDPSDIDLRPAKRRRTTPHPKSKSSLNNETHQIFQASFSLPSSDTTHPATCVFPSRSHPVTYHRPLLLYSPSSRQSLLTWFDKVHSARNMPWRKPWINPSEYASRPSDLHAALSQRAYEVWISEIMLQQTRVAVVTSYWTRWMARWPTISDLAAAKQDEVLAMWQGLGYYSRARRIHEAAALVCADPEMRGLLPKDVGELQKRVPGVGRYTAGAIAAIVFGLPEALVDGNVLRVLSRQLGVLGDVKGDRRVVEVLWEAAGELVKAVARDGDGEDVSDRPGKWGQALMELGSTVCTPRPNCGKCPVTETCRAYAEGLALAKGHRTQALQDVEDICGLCAPFDEAEEGAEARTKTNSKRGALSFFFTPTQTTKTRITGTATAATPDDRTLEAIISHAKKFPLKIPKKKVREEETLVCAIRRVSDNQYLIYRRPDKGLLAGMWEFPSHILPESNDSTAKDRKNKAMSYVSHLVEETKAKGAKNLRKPTLRHTEEIGSVPWQFSHLRLTMHVHLFELDDVDGSSEVVVKLEARQRWATGEDIDMESMGTGMKKCWSLVKERVR
ncbi:A/G-specific adenine DNA glycosylase [Madurella mycetomatis]|uniref:Adenine DNA glycosylase n=1 Tax=Madurella mycetomatis TaxID=100816 RepID=A0A175W3N4_9PEZI|nr:A/G-specific adenine DNA glycosylase [Madurella mycetomatis]